MVYNAMYPIRQNPYFQRDNRNFVKRKGDEESSKSSQLPNNDQQETSINDSNQRSSGHQQLIESKEANALAISSRDAKIKSATINIAQILKDFKNTAAAIGTPDELNQEVNTYLSLVESQVTKDNPAVKVIKSNLKNAASLLDNYIAETLQRPSQVVENWLDALFLQQINYKYDSGQVNPQFLVKFPDGRKLSEVAETTPVTTAEEPVQEAPVKTNVTMPSDTELKTLFLQAKKYAVANEPQKAMATFKQALNRSVEVSDSDTQSKVFYEIGKIYDKSDYLSQALTSYNNSLNVAQDNNVKIKAHFSMAQIYDDVAQFEPAIDHYMSSISYAGESENFTAQSTSLTKIANIHTDKYDKGAFDYYNEAKLIAAEGDDSKVKGYVSSNMADAYSQFNQPQDALKSYSEAIQSYKDADSPLKMATTYQKAADVMTGYGNSQKAKSLLQKALTYAQQTNNTDLITEINSQLTNL